jgi:hypothetical protein
MAGGPGNATTFFQGSGLGLTTALGVLRRGFVLVGNVPTSGGVIQEPGSLLFLDRNGNQLASYTNQLNGPWDLTIEDEFDHTLVFVSNVNTGTVTRLNLAISSTAITVTSATVIASGYSVAPNMAALILGPTGLAYNPQNDILYVASTNDKRDLCGAAGWSSDGIVGRRGGHIQGPAPARATGIGFRTERRFAHRQRRRDAQRRYNSAERDRRIHEKGQVCHPVQCRCVAGRRVRHRCGECQPRHRPVCVCRRCSQRHDRVRPERAADD